MNVHIALIRESDSVMRPTKVVTLAEHLAALQELKRGRPPQPAPHYPFTSPPRSSQ